MSSVFQGQCFVVSAPSGAGKTSLVKEVAKRMPELQLSISQTTRTPRSLETQGESYHFVSKETFLEDIKKEQFLEWAKVYGNYYGTSRRTVQEALLKGQDIILEIDCQGALCVQKYMKEAVLIFILPPSLSECKRRLESRAQDTQSIIKQRVQAAQSEIPQFIHFDYLLVNDCFEKSVLALENIIKSEGFKNTPKRFDSLVSKILKS